MPGFEGHRRHPCSSTKARWSSTSSLRERSRVTSPRHDIRLRLRKPLERSIRSGHPWIYRDALVPFTAEPGRVVTVEAKSGRFLARGLADSGPIGVRVFTTRDEPLEPAFFQKRIERAISLRERIVPPHTSA